MLDVHTHNDELMTVCEELYYCDKMAEISGVRVKEIPELIELYHKIIITIIIIIKRK